VLFCGLQHDSKERRDEVSHCNVVPLDWRKDHGDEDGAQHSLRGNQNQVLPTTTRLDTLLLGCGEAADMMQ
jgi:hypothetical protein